jgi:DNA-damage-inducible protein D
MTPMDDVSPPPQGNIFERIKRTGAAGAEFWSAREMARVLDYSEYRNFQPVIEKAKEACRNSQLPVCDHFVEMHEMVEIGSGAGRAHGYWALSRYARSLVIQNADPSQRLRAGKKQNDHPPKE